MISQFRGCVERVCREGVLVPGDSKGRARMRAKHNVATPTAGIKTGACVNTLIWLLTRNKAKALRKPANTGSLTQANR